MDDDPEPSAPREDGGTTPWTSVTITALELVQLLLPLAGEATSPVAMMATGLVLWLLRTIVNGW
ncbi:hypothetical protein [Nocardia bovistercoris]|uniref:Uncharacterized protein n=1 Tax=Nocardia bovistercoris TaxID=2785916 RepID=A0A931IHA8_9NOCA|nr:hypothetical protein [Nocardia bovistercoris]MBH0780376.1 hypothetical protein [Nocardia bovistercoris]